MKTETCVYAYTIWERVEDSVDEVAIYIYLFNLPIWLLTILQIFLLKYKTILNTLKLDFIL